jgi:hypothetical protein
MSALGGVPVLNDAAPIRILRPFSLTQAVRQASNYSKLVVWLLYGVFKGRTTKLISALVLSVVHLGSQATGILALYWYARQMELDGTLKVPQLGLALPVRTDTALLWAVVIFSAACFVTSAYLLFLSRRLILDIVEDHYARALEQLGQQTARLPDPRARMASRLLMNYGPSSLATSARFGALTTINFCNALTSVLGGTGAAVILFRIDTPLTLLILLGAALGGVLLYPLTLRASHLAKEREKAQWAFQRNARRLRQAYPPPQASTDSTPFTGLAKAHLGARRVKIEFIFATEISVTIIMALVVYYMAREMMAGGQSWAVLIAYLGALRLTLVGSSQALRAYASVSRSYPQLMRYYLFTKDIEKIDQEPLGKVKCGDRLILGRLHDGSDVTVTVGESVALASTESMQRLKCALLNASPVGSNAPLSIAVCDPKNSLAGSAAITLIDGNRLVEALQDRRAELTGALKDTVTLIVNNNPANIGAVGEEDVLIMEDDELRSFLRLGTAESDAALQEFARKARKKREKALPEDEDEEEEDNDE